LAAADPSAADPREAALARIRRAMTTWPEMVSGAGRLDTELMKAEPRACAKGGAEALQACATWIDGAPAGVAVKIADGGGRAAGPALLDTLRQLLWDGKIPVALAKLRRPELTNHRGTAVGAVEPAVELSRA
jgi:L-asparaginase II